MTLTGSSLLEFGGSATGWRVLGQFGSEAQARAFAVRFPKSAGLRVHGRNVSAGAVLAGSVANGGVNEAGLARYRSLVARAEKLRVGLRWSRAGEGFERVALSRQEFELLIGVVRPQRSGA